MFEKEAKEYVSKIRHDVKNWDGAEPEERFYNEIKFKQAYQQGAEFGYNKCNQQLTKAKEIIKDLLKCLPNENVEGIYEVTVSAEEFLRRIEE